MALVSLRGLSPIDALLELQGSLDHLLGNPAAGLNLGPSAGGIFPSFNIFADNDGSLVFRAEVPGIDPGKLDISVESHRLTVSGERKAPEGRGNYHRRERRFGQFSRTVQLPEGLDPDQVSAECRDGILTVRIGTSEAAKPRRIEVQSK
jgi:HSP20 family protein